MSRLLGGGGHQVGNVGSGFPVSRARDSGKKRATIIWYVIG